MKIYFQQGTYFLRLIVSDFKENFSARVQIGWGGLYDGAVKIQAVRSAAQGDFRFPVFHLRRQRLYYGSFDVGRITKNLLTFLSLQVYKQIALDDLTAFGKCQ